MSPTTAPQGAQGPADANPAQRIVSGMRPTGLLHLGHWHGVLTNWIKLQKGHECFFFIADWHALTTEYEHPEIITTAQAEMAVDWLAAGVDPEKATIFVQSHVPEHSELFLLLAMVTPVAWLERVPSYKDRQQELTGQDLATYGFLGYPLLQASDIAVYKGQAVPVGQDQVPHLELARMVIRRFNHLFNGSLVEPQALLTEFPKLGGLDGRKMSKSYNNAIYLSDSVDTITAKMKKAFTDVHRLRRSDPGEPDRCNIFPYHLIHTDHQTLEQIRHDCRSAALGCVDCKQILIKNMLRDMAPLRAARADWSSRRGDVQDILWSGSQHARTIAEETLNECRAAVGLKDRSL